jgi:hypothetical protein
MHAYRLYLINAEERIAAARIARHQGDREALAEAAQARQDYHAVEVWEGQRLVGRLGAEFVLPR